MRCACLSLLVLVVAACGDKEAAERLDARWDINDEDNLAVPVCAACGGVLDRSKDACPDCNKPFRIVEKTIDCPECQGSKTCVHCGAASKCVACDGTQKCALCEGSGRFDGKNCPDCTGKGHCAECASGASATCERCAGSHECSNCDGKGTITLR